MYLGDLHEEHGVPKPRKRVSRCSIALSILLTFVIICICHQLLEPVNQLSVDASRPLQSDPHDRHPHKVVAVVQYHNPDRISLLDCYLKRDLTTNAGPLSSVIFFAHADISPSDSHALDALISTSPDYIRYNISNTIPSPKIPILLPLIAEPKTIYITIPSTTVYIRPSALTHLITSKLARPSQPITIANSITAPDRSPSTPSHRQRTGRLTPTLRTVSDPPLLRDDEETVPSRKAPASVQEYRSLLLSRLAANTHLGAQPPPLNDDETDPAEEDAGGEARLHTAILSSLTLGRLDKWVVRSHRIAPLRGTSARTLEGTVVAVWGADVLDQGQQGSVWDGEARMDGRALVALLDNDEETELLEQWKQYASDIVCPSRLGEEAQGLRQEGVELK